VLPVWWSSVSRQAVSIFGIIHPAALSLRLREVSGDEFDVFVGW